MGGELGQGCGPAMILRAGTPHRMALQCPLVCGMLFAVASANSGAFESRIRHYGFLTHFEISPLEARQRVRQMYHEFGIVDFQFYDVFYRYSEPLPKGNTWISKPSACFTGTPRQVRKETVQAYTDEIRRLPGGHARSWLYVQAMAADEPADQMPQFSPWRYASGTQVAWTDQRKCMFVYKLTTAWGHRMVDMWAPPAVDLGFDGIHWDSLGRVSDDPSECAEMAASVTGFLQLARGRLWSEWRLRQTFNFVDGFGWHPSLYEGNGNDAVEFPYWECWTDQTEWIFWSLFNYSAKPAGHAVFVRYPDPNCCGNPVGSNADANLMGRWARAVSACNAYLVLGDGNRRVKTEYLPVNVAFNNNDRHSLSMASVPSVCGTPATPAPHVRRANTTSTTTTTTFRQGYAVTEPIPCLDARGSPQLRWSSRLSNVRPHRQRSYAAGVLCVLAGLGVMAALFGSCVYLYRHQESCPPRTQLQDLLPSGRPG